MKGKALESKKIIERVKRSEVRTKNVTFRISEELLKVFSEKCDQANVSKNKVIEELIRYFVEN